MGGFAHVWQLAKNWRSLGHDVWVFSPATGPADEQSPTRLVRIPVIPLPYLRPLSAYLLSFLFGLFSSRTHRPDLIYAREMFSPLLVLLARCSGCPLFLEINGDSFADHRRRGASALRRRWVEAIQSFNFTRAAKVFAVTEGLRRTLIERHGLPGEKVVALPNGADTDLFFPRAAAECRKILSLPARGPVVGFVGTFYEYQGLDILIQAAPAVLKKFPDALFLLAGDGVERAAWEDLAGRAGLKSRFLFTGQVPYEKVPLYLNAMDVAVAPFRSFRGETSPLKIFDAWACAKAVVASDIPALASLKTGEEKWVAVPPDDPAALAAALNALLSDPDRRERLGRAGFRHIQNGHRWQDVAREIIEHVAHDRLR